MASTIQLKTGTGSAVPSSLTQGEVAINVDNGLIYYGSGSVNSVKQLESFTHITSSGNISASGFISASSFSGDGSGLTNVTATATIPAGTVSSSAQLASDISGSFTSTSSSFSTRIAAAESELGNTLISSSAQITGSSLLLNHITASGNISSSGTLIGNSLRVLGTTGQVNSSNILTVANVNAQLAETDLESLTVGSSTVATNVTAVATTDNAEFFIGVLDGASGTQVVETSTKLKYNPNSGKLSVNGAISSSGTVIANKLEADQLVSHVGDANTGLSFAADTVVIEGNDVNLGLFATNRIELNKPITASGTISASGTIYGRQWEQIETNLNADIGSLSGGHDGDDFIFLPWTDTDTENAGSGNKFVNRAAVAPGKPIKTAMRATSNALGNTAYTMSLWENKTDQGNNNLVLVTEACANSTGTNREVVTFDWTNPCSGSNVDIAYGSKMWMGIKTTNGAATYAITHLWEWDYGSL